MSQVDSQATLQEIKLLNWWQVSISPGSWGRNSNLFRWIIKLVASHSQRSRIATSCNCKAPDPPRCSRCGTWSRLLPQDRTETIEGIFIFSKSARYVSKPPVPDWERLPGLWPSRTSCCKSSSQAGINVEFEETWIRIIFLHLTETPLCARGPGALCVTLGVKCDCEDPW